MICTATLAQEPERYREAPGSGGAATLPATVFFPEMELADGGQNWEDLQPGLFYEVSAPAYWNGPKNGAPSTEEKLGWVMEINPKVTEYVSIDEDAETLTWIVREENMLEEITDSTVARAIKRKALEGIYTVDVSGEYLDILGSISGLKQGSRNFQIMRYADKLVMYDYNNKIMRVMDLDNPKKKDDIIKDEE